MTIVLIAISQFLEAFCPTMLTADHFQAQSFFFPEFVERIFCKPSEQKSLYKEKCLLPLNP